MTRMQRSVSSAGTEALGAAGRARRRRYSAAASAAPVLLPCRLYATFWHIDAALPSQHPSQLCAALPAGTRPAPHRLRPCRGSRLLHQRLLCGAVCGPLRCQLLERLGQLALGGCEWQGGRQRGPLPVGYESLACEGACAWAQLARAQRPPGVAPASGPPVAHCGIHPAGKAPLAAAGPRPLPCSPWSAWKGARASSRSSVRHCTRRCDASASSASRFASVVWCSASRRTASSSRCRCRRARAHTRCVSGPGGS